MAFDNDGKAVNIVAPTGGLKAGQFFYDDVSGFAGQVLDTVDAGESVALEIVRGHRINLPASLNVVAGDVLHVLNNGTLGRAPSTSGDPAVATPRPYMKVTEVVDNVTTISGAAQDQVIGVLLPQTWAKFTKS